MFLLSSIAIFVLLAGDHGVAAAEGWLLLGTYGCDQTEYTEAAAQTADECTAACSKASTPENEYVYAEFNDKRQPTCRCYLRKNPCDDEHYTQNADSRLYENAWKPDVDNRWVFADHKFCAGTNRIRKYNVNFQDLCTSECQKAGKDIAVFDTSSPDRGERCECATQADCTPGRETKGVNRFRMSSQQHGYSFYEEQTCTPKWVGDPISAEVTPVEDCLKYCKTFRTYYVIFDGRDATRPQCQCVGQFLCDTFEDLRGVQQYYNPEFQWKEGDEPPPTNA